MHGTEIKILAYVLQPSYGISIAVQYQYRYTCTYTCTRGAVLLLILTIAIAGMVPVVLVWCKSGSDVMQAFQKMNAELINR